MDIVDTYDHFYKTNKDRLFAYLLRMTGDAQSAKDLAQESFARYWGRYRNRGCSKALLYTIARNAAIDALQKYKKTSPIDTDSCAFPGKTPEQETILQEEYNRMLKALAQLNVLDRELISMVATGEFSYQEIGQRLEISEANVKVRVHRARKKLQRILSQEAYHE